MFRRIADDGDEDHAEIKRAGKAVEALVLSADVDRAIAAVEIAQLQTFPVEVASEPPPKGFVAKSSIWPFSKKTWIIIGAAAGGAVVLGTAIGLGVYFGTRGPTVTVFNPVNP